MEIGTWENYGGKQVWRFIGGRYNEVLLYVFKIQTQNTVFLRSFDMQYMLSDCSSSIVFLIVFSGSSI